MKHKSGSAPSRHIMIGPHPPGLRAYWRELLAFREVVRMLVRRDLIVRFRQTYLGLAWLLFKPLMLMAVLSFTFGYLAGFEKNHDVPYPLVIFCGVIPWYFFSNAVPDSMYSLAGNMHIVQKVYFPRGIVPIAAAATDSIEFAVAWLLFVAGCVWYGYLPGWQIVVFPLFCLQLLVLCVFLGLWLAVLAVRFRDIRNLVPFMLTIGFFISPVGYTSQRIPDHWELLYWLNPLVGIIEGLRWSLLNGFEGFPLLPVALSLGTTLVVALLAIRQLLANEIHLADLA